MTTKFSRARSTDYKNHVGLVAKLTMRYYGRAAAAKLPSITYDDVHSEMLVAFVKAAEGYDPQSGFTFGAFYGRCAQNHMNKWLGRESMRQFGRDRADPGDTLEYSGAGIGLCFEADLQHDELDSETNLCDRLADDSADPADRVDAMRTLAGVISDRNLLPETRAYIAMLANPSSFQESVMARINERFSEVSEEIRRVWGISITRNSL